MKRITATVASLIIACFGVLCVYAAHLATTPLAIALHAADYFVVFGCFFVVVGCGLLLATVVFDN
jgi:hypothetical protein